MWVVFPLYPPCFMYFIPLTFFHSPTQNQQNPKTSFVECTEYVYNKLCHLDHFHRTRQFSIEFCFPILFQVSKYLLVFFCKKLVNFRNKYKTPQYILVIFLTHLLDPFCIWMSTEVIYGPKNISDCLNTTKIFNFVFYPPPSFWLSFLPQLVS